MIGIGSFGECPSGARRAWVVLLWVGGLTAGPVMAQQGTVSGVVVDGRTGAPVSAVQVFVRSLELGTLTNASGRFVLANVPAGTHRLQAERIGYRGAEQAVTVGTGVNAAVEVTFAIQTEPLGLNEVVVTGVAGQARRREVGNAISQINLDNVVEPVQSVESLLQGRAPGVNVIMSSGQVGDGAKIRLRGNVSAALNNQPLIYIDGVRVKSDGYGTLNPISMGQQYGTMQMSSPLNDINPDDIERIEIIKGASATTLFGAEAATGVIQIFTKRGLSGAPSWSLDVTQGFVEKAPFGVRETLRGTPIDEVGSSYPTGGNAKYMGLDPWMRRGWRQNYNLSLRGGTDVVRYFVSGGLENNQGLFETESEEKYMIRGNFGIQLSPSLNLDWNTAYNETYLNNIGCGNDIYGICLQASRAPFNYLPSGDYNELSKMLNRESPTEISRLVTGATLRFQPFEALTNSITLGYDRSGYHGRITLPYDHVMRPAGLQATTLRNQSLLTLEYVGTFATTFTPAFAADFSVGGQSITDESQEVRGQSEGFPGPGMVTLNSGAVTIARESRRRTITGGFFGQALLKFEDRYFVTLGLRMDGNSVFGDNFGWQIYPKVSGSYVISDEAFWPSILGQVKLRAAYGAAGRAPGAFDALRTWNPVSWGGQSAFLPGNRGNPNLGPENTAEIDVGLDGAWFDGRLVADFSYYRRTTSDALVSVGSAGSAGGWGSQLENVGELRASGLELALTGTVLEGSSYSWDIGADVSTNHSEVLSLGGLPGFGSGDLTRIEVGYPVPVVRGDLILNPDERAPIADERNHYFGPNTPTLILAPRTTLQLPRGLVLSARGEYQGGHYLYDGATRWAAATGGTLYQCAEAAVDIAGGNLDNLTAREHAFCRRENLRSGYFVYPADFFKLREISLQIPVTDFVPGASNALVTVSGRNLYRWLNDEFTAWDPEVTGWSGVNSFANVIWEQPAPPKLFSMSLRVSF